MKVFTIFNVRDNQRKFHAVKRDFIIEIYRKRAQSVKISCSEISCTLKPLNITCSENTLITILYVDSSQSQLSVN